MPLTINTNVMSLNSQRNLTNNTNALAKSMERLSSGFRINKAGDDAVKDQAVVKAAVDER